MEGRERGSKTGQEKQKEYLDSKEQYMRARLEYGVIGHSVEDARREICGYKIELDREGLMEPFAWAQWNAHHDFTDRAEKNWDKNNWEDVAEGLTKVKTLSEALEIINRSGNVELKATMRREGIIDGLDLAKTMEYYAQEEAEGKGEKWSKEDWLKSMSRPKKEWPVEEWDTMMNRLKKLSEENWSKAIEKLKK